MCVCVWGDAGGKSVFAFVFALDYVTATKLLAALTSQHKVSSGLICGSSTWPGTHATPHPQSESPLPPPAVGPVIEIKMQTKQPTECVARRPLRRLAAVAVVAVDSLKWTKFRNNGLLIYGPTTWLARCSCHFGQTFLAISINVSCIFMAFSLID